MAKGIPGEGPPKSFLCHSSFKKYSNLLSNLVNYASKEEKDAIKEGRAGVREGCFLWTLERYAHCSGRFATTSIPKKAPVAQVEKEYPDATVFDSTAAEEPENAPTVQLDSRGIALQELVDKLQDKVEKEITRTLKVGNLVCTIEMI